MVATILVTGGAGFIGSHMVLHLVEHGYRVIVFDNLSTGNRDAVLAGELVVADLADQQAVMDCFRKHRIDAVMHFAASALVGESVEMPQLYYQNNVLATLNLLDAMKVAGVDKLIFSSTCAVYGEPVNIPMSENHRLMPVNPYGWSKLMAEQILQDYDRAFKLRSISLRYFNAAGADPQSRLAERRTHETHLIPLTLQVANGQRDCLHIYGNDYPTDDGTCVRDYIHINDLCQAHLLALKALLAGAATTAYNVGLGHGASVNEVVCMAREITGSAIPSKVVARRLGDPPTLVADATRIRQELGWQPAYEDLTTMIKHSWQVLKKADVAEIQGER